MSASDNKIRDNLKDTGTRVITFPSLLKWNARPAMDLIIDLLKIGEEALGCPLKLNL